MSDVVKPVSYVFETSADVGEWLVLELHLEEALSRPYLARLRLCQPISNDSDLELFLGADAAVVMMRDDAIERRQCGLVHDVRFISAHNESVIVELELVPALSMLEQRIATRIFQDLSAADILEGVFGEALGDYQRSVVLDDLKRTFPVREYTVQYRESDFDFVHRLMEEEGVFYYFDHSGDVEELRLVDSNDVCPACELVSGSEIPLRRDGFGTHGTESIDQMAWDSALQPTSVVVRDFDWTRPALDLTREARAQDDKGRDRELYWGAILSTVGDYNPLAYGAEDGQEQADLRAQAEVAGCEIGSLSSNVINIRPGVTIEIGGHDLDIDLSANASLVLWAEHEGSANLPGLGSEERGVGYRNRFRCMPTAQPYRPPRRRAERRIAGPQTATVVGPSSEEVHTDEHGRVKVQFHWHRDGKRDEHSSCWLRVAQWWAAAGFGTVFIPRIGMEVVVHFIDGNPDRPLVTGCVYNGENPTAYGLPDEKTKSTLYTNSSIGGGGHNELTFEDAKGSELVYQHAQGVWNSDVLADMTTNVGANQALDVSGSRSKDVGGSQTAAIDGNDDNTIGSNQTSTISGNDDTSVGGNRTASIGGNDDATVGGSRTTSVGGTDTLSVGGSQSVGISGSFNHNVGGTYNLTVGGGHTLKTTVLGGWNELVGGDYKQLVAGMKSGVSLGFYEVKAGASGIHLIAAAKVGGFAGVKLKRKGGAFVARVASQVSHNALDNTSDSTATNTVKGGGSTCTLVPGAPTIEAGGNSIDVGAQIKMGTGEMKNCGEAWIKGAGTVDGNWYAKGDLDFKNAKIRK